MKKKRLGLLVAVEMTAVTAHYGEPDRIEARGGFEISLYDRPDFSLFVIHSGLGELAASAATQLLLDRYEVDLVVNFGVVGGLTGEMTRTKLCVVTRVVHYDFDISGIDPLEPGQYPGFPDVYLPADADLVARALAVAPDLRPVTCASADKFVAAPEQKQALHERYGAEICEMESAAILLCCLRNGVPALFIKAVADGLTGGGEEYYTALQESAARCLEVTDRIMREL